MSSTPTNGSPESESEPTLSPSTKTEAAPAHTSKGLVLIAFVAVGLALYIGSQGIGVLFSIAQPPQPPRPDDARQIDYTSTAYGVDEWVYSTGQDACVLSIYYQNLGAVCNAAPGMCARGKVTAAGAVSGQNVAQCSGEMQFSIFAMQWSAVIATGYSGDEPTRFRLSREVFWTGGIPPANFFDRQPTPIPPISSER